jgi:hypothetical protein
MDFHLKLDGSIDLVGANWVEKKGSAPMIQMATFLLCNSAESILR